MGRGPKYKYTPELLAEAAKNSLSIAGVLRYLGIPWSGGMHAYISRRLRHFEIDTSHFTGSVHNRGIPARNRMPADQVLVLRPAGSGRLQPKRLRRALREIGVPYRCSCCGLGDEWQGRRLVLHVDHINGDYLDCRPENLRFLCPNCHTQTASWAGRNRPLRSYLPPPESGRPIVPVDVPTLFVDP